MNTIERSVTNLKINWLYQLKRQTKTPWKSDALRITWFYVDTTKQAIYEYRDENGKTNGFAITQKLQDLLPPEINKKYFEAHERALVFSLFFNEISEFCNDFVEPLEFLNFTGVIQDIFFSEDAQNALLELIEV